MCSVNQSAKFFNNLIFQLTILIVLLYAEIRKLKNKYIQNIKQREWIHNKERKILNSKHFYVWILEDLIYIFKIVLIFILLSNLM